MEILYFIGWFIATITLSWDGKGDGLFLSVYGLWAAYRCHNGRVW